MPRGKVDVIAAILSRSVFSRREIALWLGSVLFGRYMLSLVHALVIDQTSGKIVNFFQLFAWFVLLRLLARSAGQNPARVFDFGALALCALCAVLPGDNAIWIAATLASIYFWVTRNGDPFRSSASALLIALATNGVWGPLFFSFVGNWLLDFDAWLLAKVLQTTGALTSHQANQVTVGNGTLEIFGPCSSFRNISMALLAWLSLTKFIRPYWVRADIAVAAACVAVTLFWNTMRLTVLALFAADTKAFDFWHSGHGEQILAAVLGFAIAAISVAGASRASA